MKTTFKIILGFLFILTTLNVTLVAQTLFSTDQISCTSKLNSSLTLSTGIDENGNLLSPGEGVVDPFWQLVQIPSLNFCTQQEQQAINGSAYLVNFNNANATSWVNQEKATAISPVNAGLSGILNCQNANLDGNISPFVFDRLFCLEAGAEITLDVNYKADDQLRVALINLNTGVVEAQSGTYTYQNPPPVPMNFNASIGLNAGTYALRAFYVNGGIAGAFSVQGSVSVIGNSELLSNATYTTLAENCEKTDTLASDAYFFYPDSALTICLDENQLPANRSYSFEWLDASGNVLSSGSDTKTCFEIAALNEKTVGTYYAVASDLENNICFVFPIEVERYVQDPTGAWYIPDQLVVKYRKGITEAGKQAYRDRYQATLLDSCMCLIDLLQLPDTLYDENGNPIIDPEEKKKKAGEDVDAETVGWNTIQEEEWLRSKTNFGLPQKEQQQLATAFFEEEEANNGDSIIVALIDTGLDYNQATFQDYLWKNPEPYPMSTDSCKVCITGAEFGYDFGDDDNDPMDDLNHGTFVANAIVYAAEALSAPAQPKLKIMPLKVADDKHTISLFSVTCATIFAVRNGAMVINLSMGGQGGYQDMLAAALVEVDTTKCIPMVITSAGNDTLDNTIFPHYFSNLNDSLDYVLSVGAIETLPTDGFVTADYSNYGVNVDIATNGNALFSTAPFTGVKGTSISAGYVSGIMAFILEEKPGISWQNAKDCILQVANNKGTSDFANASGLRFDGRTGVSWKSEMLEHLFALEDENCTYTNQACLPLVTSTFQPPQDKQALEVQVYPNPTKNVINFAYELPRNTRLNIQLFEASGRVIFNQHLDQIAGSHQFEYSLSNLPAGIYFYQIVTETHIHAGKVIKQRQ